MKPKLDFISFRGEVEIDSNDYQTVAVGEKIPVFYDPDNDAISYPSPNGLLGRVKPDVYFRHSLLLWITGTLVMAMLMGGALIADSKAARRPLP